MAMLGASAAVVALTAGCSGDAEPAAPRAPEALSHRPWAEREPRPEDTFTTNRTVTSDGAVVLNDFVRVEIPQSAVASGAEVTVGLDAPLGNAVDAFARESWGAPVRIAHQQPLRKPVTITWNVASLTDEQRSSVALVRWDPERLVWSTADEPVKLDGTNLRAEVSRFSVLDFVTNGAADLGQTFGEWLGKRAQAPTCTGKLPAWVASVVRPDEDLSATAIRTCVEPDAKTGGLTVRVANNRSYSQHLALEPAGTTWPWLWPGEPDLSPLGTVWTLAHAALDTTSVALMPPTRTMAFGIDRPTGAGQVTVSMTARADVVTVFADAIGLVIDNMSVGGLEDPVLNAFVQALYECGGKALLKSRPHNIKDLAALATSAAKDCVSGIVGGGDSDLAREVMTSFENALRAQIAKGGTASTRAIQAGRLVHEISARLWYLDLFQAVEYLGNQLADSFVGPTTLTLHLTGTPQKLGAWKPTCTGPPKDSNLLYRNLALQDRYTRDKSKGLWQFPSWSADARTAVAPLAQCSAAHRDAVAKDVEKSWGDTKAAAVVATAIRSLNDGAGKFAGSWIVHGGGMDITQAGRVTVTNHTSCADPMTNAWCNEVAAGTGTLSADGTMLTVNITGSRVVDAATNRAQPGVELWLMPGDRFELRFEKPGLLKTTYLRLSGKTAQAEVNLANPYWCGEGLRDSSEYCGA